jgi:hypothetical protein
MGAAQTLRTETGSVRPVADQTAFDRELEIVRTQLGEDSFAALWREGVAMSLEAAASLAASGSIQPLQPGRRVERQKLRR